MSSPFHRELDATSIDELLRVAKARFEAMTPEEKAAMIEAQRQSWLRGMAPCEHGVADWEDCPDCRKA